MNGVIQCKLLCAWFLLLSAVSVRCAHVVVSTGGSLLALFHTTIYLAVLLMDFGLFPVFTIMNKVDIMNKAGVLKY